MRSSCLSFPSAVITGVCHQAKLLMEISHGTVSEEILAGQASLLLVLLVSPWQEL